ncbi:hypothetical protein [Rheinheimera sp.]|uniref:hypothetical protein n=1 Tax=Rheinheimera sp. TaxID=1869214 RepID=UPI0027BA8BCE|nr:hypothetical protein [Rheinheimera sp.]
MKYFILFSAALISIVFSFYHLKYFVDYFSAYFGYFVGGAIIPLAVGVFVGILADKLSRKFSNPMKSWILFVVTSVFSLLPPIYLLLAVTFLNNL